MPNPLVKRKWVVKIEYAIETTENSEVIRSRIKAELFREFSRLRQSLMFLGWLGTIGSVWLTIGRRTWTPSTTSTLSPAEDALKRDAEVKYDEKYVDDYNNKIAIQLKRYPETQVQA